MNAARRCAQTGSKDARSSSPTCCASCRERRDTHGSSTSCRSTSREALSHYQIERVTNLLAHQTHAAVTTSRHVSMADALKARCVLAEVRWRWTLKVLWAACTERNLCADPTLLNPCIFLS